MDSLDFRSSFRFHPHQGGEWNRKGLVSDQGQRKKAWYIMRDYYNQKKNRTMKHKIKHYMAALLLTSMV